MTRQALEHAGTPTRCSLRGPESDHAAAKRVPLRSDGRYCQAVPNHRLSQRDAKQESQARVIIRRSLPFDIRHWRRIGYDETDLAGLEEALIQAFRAVSARYPFEGPGPRF
jgi:hypothetical protein